MSIRNILCTTDENVKEIMENNGLDEETAERVQDIIENYGLDEDEAVELVDDLD